MSFGFYADIAINLVQQLMFVGFLNLFFDKGENKLKNIVSFVVTVIVLFSVSNYMTLDLSGYKLPEEQITGVDIST